MNPTTEAIMLAMDIVRTDILTSRNYGDNEKLAMALRLAEVDPARIAMSYSAMIRAYEVMHRSTLQRPPESG